MSVYTSFFPGFGLEALHWGGKASRAVLLETRGDWQGEGITLPDCLVQDWGWGGGRRRIGRSLPGVERVSRTSGHCRNFTGANMTLSLWFREDAVPHEKMVSSSFLGWHEACQCLWTSCHHFYPHSELCFPSG